MYIVADLVGPDLSVVDVVVLVGEVIADDVVDFFLHERTDVVEDCLFLLAHFYIAIQIAHSQA
jgi:CBS domain-containing protein